MLLLYGCPKACSLVSHIALEVVGAPFEYRFVDLFKGQQNDDAFRAQSPRGKVPLLAANEMRLTENIAILSWLSARFPKARLLPEPGSQIWFAATADLAWFASGVHPTMTRMLAPFRLVHDKACQHALSQSATEALVQELKLIDQRLSNQRWWLGGWSALDAYVFWIWARAGEGPIDLSLFRHCARHAQDMLALPEVHRALERERGHLSCFEQLDAAGS